MTTPNPLIPQGSLERHSRGKSTVRIAIFTIVSIHAVFFTGLLMQGCRRDDGKTALKTADAMTNQNTLPPLDPGYYASTQEVGQPSAPANAANPISPVVSDAGSSLPPAQAIEPLAEGKAYTIAKGDTLAKIAKANGTTVGALSKANPSVDPAKLRPGQKIQIPPAAAPSAPAAPATAGLGLKEPGKTESAPGSSSIYAVKPGETLTRIAKAHGTNVKALRAANNLKSDRLVVGQKLKIPAGHVAHAAGETGKTATVSKLSATNPAHVTPVTSGVPGTTVR
jgi:LysM repeat protein